MDKETTVNKEVLVNGVDTIDQQYFEKKLKEKEDEIKKNKSVIEKKDHLLNRKEDELKEKDHALNKKDNELEEKSHEIKKLQAKLEWFEEQIRLNKAKQYGKSSEQSEVIQFDLFDDEETQEQGVESEQAETITVERKKKKTTGRKIDTTDLPREVVVHDLAETEKCCETCQSELHKIGEDVSEKIEIVPALIKVIEHRRVKYACRQCDTAKSAPKPASLIPKCMAGNSLIAEVILAKYQRHIPFYRQSQIFASAKIDIPDNTIGNWCLKAFEALAPIGEVLWEQLRETHVVQVDETPVKMLSEDKKGFMWVYHSCDPGSRFVLFDYNDSRSAQVVNKRLLKFSGILQTDGYSGYNDQRARKEVVNVGCFAHCRRKFAEVLQASPGKTGKAHVAVTTIGKLYQIEREAKDLSHDQRYTLRQAQAKPILKKFYDWLIASKPQVPGQSKLGKAVNYALNQWDYLYEYIHHGEVEIDNNQVENKIRPFALGRKNWMFVGNPRGAGAAGLFYSLIETCKLNDIEPRMYLMKVFEMAPMMRRGEVDAKELLPHILKPSL